MISGDLIVEVIQEAHRRRSPAPASLADEANKATAADTATEIGSFTTTLERSSKAAESAITTLQGANAGGVRAAPKAQSPEVMLGGLLLQSMLDVMLSGQGESLTGSGTAGRMWRSMLAEQIAAEVGPSLDLKLFPEAHDRQVVDRNGVTTVDRNPDPAPDTADL